MLKKIIKEINETFKMYFRIKFREKLYFSYLGSDFLLKRFKLENFGIFFIIFISIVHFFISFFFTKNIFYFEMEKANLQNLQLKENEKKVVTSDNKIYNFVFNDEIKKFKNNKGKIYLIDLYQLKGKRKIIRIEDVKKE